MPKSESGVDRNVAEYWRTIMNIPSLSPDRELELGKRVLANRGDLEAQHELVTSHLRVVFKFARLKFQPHSPHSLIDIIGVGNQSIVKATPKFDYTMGRFYGFAKVCTINSVNGFYQKDWAEKRLAKMEAFFVEDIADRKVSIMDKEDHTYLCDTLREAVENLEVQERDLVSLKLEGKCKNSEIARKLGILGGNAVEEKWQLILRKLRANEKIQGLINEI